MVQQVIRSFRILRAYINEWISTDRSLAGFSERQQGWRHKPTLFSYLPWQWVSLGEGVAGQEPDAARCLALFAVTRP